MCARATRPASYLHSALCRPSQLAGWVQEEVDRQVEEAIRGLRFEELPGGEEYGRCAISCCDYREALQVGD